MQNLFKPKQALLILAMMLSATLSYGQTQSGALDPSFGAGGKAINDFGGRMALLPDGKILAAGGASAADGFDFSLSRFNSNGTLDTTFGSGGRVTTDLGGRFEGATSIVVQPDGKIVTGGYAVVPVNQFANFALVRYNADGSLDLSFGTGGKVLTNFGNISAQAYSMALQPDGKIVLAGYVNFNGGESFGLARYNTDGTLDAGFGTGGKVHTEFSAVGQTGSVAFAYSVALQQDGKIVAAGESTINGQRDFALARYNSNGTLDPGFGTGGKVNTDFAGFDDLVNAVTIQPDGRIVAAGAAATGTAASVLFDFALARYNSNGTLDPTFGSSGKVTTDFSGAQDFVNSVVLQPDGKLIAAGQATINGLTDGAFGLARYFSSGTLDPSFGSGGKLTTNFGPDADSAGQVVLQPDNKILVAGGAQINGISKSVMVRYLNDTLSPIPTPTPTPTPSQVGTAASFVSSDATTQGSWKGIYGADGYQVVGDAVNFPSYAQVSLTNQTLYTWASSTSDVRAVQKALTNDRIAATLYADSFFDIDINLSDGRNHQVAVYCLDWDSTSRSQRIDVLDAVSGAVLDTRNVSSFNTGRYLVWNLAGHVRLRVTRTSGANAVVNGLFFQTTSNATPTPTPTPTPSPTPTPTPSQVGTAAAFISVDAATQGSWKGIYGADGYQVVGDAVNFPSYAQVSLTNQTLYTWESSTSDGRAVQKALTNDRIAAALYADSFFTIDVNISDGSTRRVALYCVDWDSTSRSQRIDVVDAATNGLIDSRTISSFNGGKYVVWNITGHVKINVNKVVGVNAVVSGVFFR